MKKRRAGIRGAEEGFTLIELLAVIGIIGILAALAVLSYETFTVRAKIGRTATELKYFGTAFLGYSYVVGEYPPDSHNQLPPGMEDFIAPSVFNQTTPLGGRYNWEGPDFYPYAGISIDQIEASDSVVQALDSVIDDGNLATGRFRYTSNGRPTYILEEVP